MTPVKGDAISLGTGGVLVTPVSGAAEIPATPTISIAAGTNSVTVTINGDTGVTNHLVYKKESDAEWQDGGSRSGDGDLTVSGLSNNVPYIFQAYSENDEGAYSLWSLAATVTLAATAANKVDELHKATAREFLIEFGESIKYKPKGGGSRGILAILNYESPEDLGYGIQSELKSIEVMNDSIEGISSSELNRGGDMVEVPTNIGDVPMDRPITKRLYQDAGMMGLEVR